MSIVAKITDARAKAYAGDVEAAAGLAVLLPNHARGTEVRDALEHSMPVPAFRTLRPRRSDRPFQRNAEKRCSAMNAF
jgi:hypothetical protein